MDVTLINMDTVKKFFGPEEIISTTDTGLKTARGESIIEVTTKRQDSETDNRVSTTTETALKEFMSDEPRDWNALREAKLDVVVSKLMDVATDYGITGGEMNAMMTRFGLNLATRLDQAAHIRFEGNSDEFVPGGDVTYTWSLAKAEAIIVNQNVSTPEVTS